MAKKVKKTSERVIVEKVIKGPELAQVLKVRDYTLQLTSEENRGYFGKKQPIHRVYQVIDGKNHLGEIVVRTECAYAETETKICYVPYDIEIYTDRIESKFENKVPIELFKKIILATITIS